MNVGFYNLALSLPGVIQFLFLIGLAIWVALAKSNVQRVKIAALLGLACFLIAQLTGLLSPIIITRVLSSSEIVGVWFALLRILTAGLSSIGTFLLVYAALCKRSTTEPNQLPAAHSNVADSGNPYHPL